MITDNLFGILFYCISAIGMVSVGIYNINRERKEEHPDFSDDILTIIVGFTPVCMFISACLIFFVFMYSIVNVPNWILKKLLTKRKDG